MGREFIDMFDEWAESYDDTVTGQDPQYKDVFENYHDILQAVADAAEGNTLEFGVGTGNLSEKLLAKGLKVTGIEPSKEMREHASRKFPELSITDGDFLSFPEPAEQVSSIVSTWAFHHLTDHEKNHAIASYAALLPKGGKIVFADTVFSSEDGRDKLIQRETEKGYDRLVKDLTTEYYTTIEVLEKIFQAHGFYVTFMQKNRFVYLITAEKA
ncbi:class I SAM-dependent methyltransferase [Terribacillus sp. DMT04]|uniref:class I SAM-dependent DNA methyltransferase n=1 Tax=Terribacillus sp. DMT04 TaxID=2850441 RepID=UPI001C2C3B33|nr:class I SAM-dependent methyltransferase [Terribacillus sp. DMT04]QXE02629.1 class I SAM-dependent methyltransferase [Terribacillus sp. DMT04]